MLDGRGSEPGGLQSSWRQVSGPRADLAVPSLPVASFVARDAGVYVFELTVTDGSRWDTDTVEILVERRLRIEWTPAGPLAADLRSTYPGAPHSWDLGDGSTSQDETPRHTYAAAGTYLVHLSVTAADGRVLVADEEVTVEAPAAPPASPLANPGARSSAPNAFLPLLVLAIFALAAGLLLLAGLRRRRKEGA